MDSKAHQAGLLVGVPDTACSTGNWLTVHLGFRAGTHYSSLRLVSIRNPNLLLYISLEGHDHLSAHQLDALRQSHHAVIRFAVAYHSAGFVSGNTMQCACRRAKSGTWACHE